MVGCTQFAALPLYSFAGLQRCKIHKFYQKEALLVRRSGEKGAPACRYCNPLALVRRLLAFTPTNFRGIKQSRFMLRARIVLQKYLTTPELNITSDQCAACHLNKSFPIHFEVPR